MKAIKKLKVEVYKKTFYWRVRIVGLNGETVMFSERYYSEDNAKRAAKLVKGAKLV